MNDSCDPPRADASSRGFAAAPASWYHVGAAAEISAGPLSFDLPGGLRYVAFRSGPESFAVLDARCSHMSADLSRGEVKDGRIVCPLHGWEYAGDGKCARIPASADIPAFACQSSFPVEERGGHVFFFNRPQPRFPLPFFSGRSGGDLLAARPFEFTVEAPWHLVSANGFDVQHFRGAHDRTLVGEPVVDSPHPFVWRLQARFRVEGTSLRDRITRCVSGPEVEMTVENWGGNLVLVTARFRRTTTYGAVSFIPLDAQRTRLRDIVWAPRRRGALARRWLDPLDARVRRSFIREFVRSDVERSAGLRFRPDRVIAADNVLVGYLAWLQKIQPAPASSPP